MLEKNGKFNPPVLLETPILFLVFNRQDTSEKVFKTIRESKPSKLYIASDGARESKKNEKQTVEMIRKMIVDGVDWECEVKTLFRDNNLGCKYAVSSAIDWFFENEEMGIILEDDCLPSLSFFWFCQELLILYKNDLRIWHITGNNLNPTWRRDNSSSYYFGSVYASIWGWATWRDRWKHYDVEMKDYSTFIAKGHIVDIADGGNSIKERAGELSRISKGFDTWDYQWTFARWKNSGMSINPSINMIQNIGFGEDAAHTINVNDNRANMEFGDIEFPLKHPPYILRDSISEEKFYNYMPELSFINRLKIRIKRILGIPI